MNTKKLAENPETKGLLPGFEAVFVIAGLLAVAYLIRRRVIGFRKCQVH
jgi:PGF-CTERM protein